MATNGQTCPVELSLLSALENDLGASIRVLKAVSQMCDVFELEPTRVDDGDHEGAADGVRDVVVDTLGREILRLEKLAKRVFDATAGKEAA